MYIIRIYQISQIARSLKHVIWQIIQRIIEFACVWIELSVDSILAAMYIQRAQITRGIIHQA